MHFNHWGWELSECESEVTRYTGQLCEGGECYLRATGLQRKQAVGQPLSSRQVPALQKAVFLSHRECLPGRGRGFYFSRLCPSLRCPPAPQVPAPSQDPRWGRYWPAPHPLPGGWVAFPSGPSQTPEGQSSCSAHFYFISASRKDKMVCNQIPGVSVNGGQAITAVEVGQGPETRSEKQQRVWRGMHSSCTIWTHILASDVQMHWGGQPTPQRSHQWDWLSFPTCAPYISLISYLLCSINSKWRQRGGGRRATH